MEYLWTANMGYLWTILKSFKGRKKNMRRLSEDNFTSSRSYLGSECVDKEDAISDIVIMFSLALCQQPI
jgi:hypothetical protein